MHAFVLLDRAATLIHHQTQYHHRLSHPPTIVGPVIEVDNAHTAVHTPSATLHIASLILGHQQCFVEGYVVL